MVESSLKNSYLTYSNIQNTKTVNIKILLNSILIFLLIFLPTSQAYAVNVDEMLVNLQEQLGPLTQFVTAFAYLGGFYLMFKSFYALKQYGEMRTMTSAGTDLRAPLAGIAVGTALLFLPTMITTAFVTVYGSNVQTDYPTGGTGWDEMGQTLVLIVQFVGGVAFVRGLFHFYKLGQGQAQQGTFGKAVVHVIGGVIALNIVGATNILFTSLGIE